AARAGRGSPAHSPAASLTSPPTTKNRTSPVSVSSTAATTLVACTSRPTRVLAFAMAGFLLCGCGAPRGGNRAASTAPHDRRGGTGPFYRKGRTEPASIWSSTAHALFRKRCVSADRDGAHTSAGACAADRREGIRASDP